MKRYSKYKDSGAPWLGSVPTHWELGRLGSYVSLRGEKGSDKEFEPLSVTKKGIVPQLETAAKTDDGENRKIVRKGDIAINGRSDRKGSSGLAEIDGSVSLINIVLKIERGLYPKFAHHLIRSEAFQEEFYRWGRGIVADLWSTNYWDLKRIPSALPPIEEQKLISDFLDKTLGNMDSAIESQERMIELLKERRSAIITQAVTKGLDPNAKMKDSGQSWIGEVPSHWELKPNRSLFKDVGQMVENKGDGVLLLSLTQNGLIPRDMENPSGKFPSDFSTYQKVKIGDLVFCLFDVDETPRTVGISNHDGMITGAYTVVRCYNRNYAEYLYWFYLSLDEDKRLKPLYRGLRKVIPSETFRSIKSPMPSEHEAKVICEFIQKEVTSMNSAIESQERMIELLKERRSAIITQAVTGQIDVR